MNKHKILFFLLIIGIILAGLVLQKQIRIALNINTASNDRILVEDKNYDIKTEKKDPVIGNPGANLVIVEFLNFGTCKTRCQKVHEDLIKFTKKNPENVRMYFKSAASRNIFLSSNKLAHAVGYCANEQGKFWEYSNMLLKNSKKDEKGVYQVMQDAKLNITNINECLKGEAPYQKIESDFALDQTFGFKDNPSIFINGKKVNIYDDVNVEELLTKIITPKENDTTL